MLRLLNGIPLGRPLAGVSLQSLDHLMDAIVEAYDGDIQMIQSSVARSRIRIVASFANGLLALGTDPTIRLQPDQLLAHDAECMLGCATTAALPKLQAMCWMSSVLQSNSLAKKLASHDQNRTSASCALMTSASNPLHERKMMPALGDHSRIQIVAPMKSCHLFTKARNPKQGYSGITKICCHNSWTFLKGYASLEGNHLPMRRHIPQPLDAGGLVG